MPVRPVLAIFTLLAAFAAAQEKPATFTGEIRLGAHTTAMAAGNLYLIRAEGERFAPSVTISGAGKNAAVTRGKDFHQVLHAPAKSGEHRVVVGLPPTGSLPDTPLRYKLTIIPVRLGPAALVQKGKLAPDGPTYRNDKAGATPHKAFKLSLKGGVSYTIDLKEAGDSFDPYLILEGPDGKAAAEDDDGGGGMNARIRYRPAADGEYRIIATSFLPGAKGRFTLTARRDGDGSAPLLSQVGEITPDDARYSRAGPSAVVRRGPFKAYTITLKRGRAYVIDMEDIGDSFDPYLILEGPGGHIVARDDDGGEKLNARVYYRAAADGEYRIVATSMSKAARGRFTVTVRPVEE
jgi:hypothetical protein